MFSITLNFEDSQMPKDTCICITWCDSNQAANQSWANIDTINRQIRLGVLNPPTACNRRINRVNKISLDELESYNAPSTVIHNIKDFSPKAFPNIIPIHDDSNSKYALHGHMFYISTLKFGSKQWSCSG